MLDLAPYVNDWSVPVVLVDYEYWVQFGYGCLNELIKGILHFKASVYYVRVDL